MTLKPTLQRWADALGADISASATVQELEQAIESAIATPEPDLPSLRESLAIHWQLARTEVPQVARAIVQNLLN